MDVAKRKVWSPESESHSAAATTERTASGEALRTEVAALLGGSGELSEILNRCCQLLVNRLQVVLARIWNVVPEESALKLQASAGLSNRTTGFHCRVRIGDYRIGAIARDRRPLLTNNVIGDPLIHDQEWARREGIQSFAGYPLVADGELVGVLAMFSQQPISTDDFRNLEIIAALIANYIRRKFSERQLRESEDRFRILAQCIQLIPWQADATSWGFTYVGPQATAILGYPVADWYATDFWIDHIHPDDRQLATDICRQRMESGETDYQLEYRMLRADGSWIWFLDIVQVLKNEEGGDALQGFLIDITARKQTEHARQESQQRLQLIADALPVLIAYIDAQGRYQFNNAAYEQWFGSKPSSLQGRQVSEVLGPVAFAAIRPYFENALRGKQQAFEQRIPFVGVGTRSVHVHYIPHRAADGTVLGFCALIIDISERIRAEETLRDREARLAAILDTAPDAIITVNAQRRIEAVNPAAETLFGYAAGELIGQNVDMLMADSIPEGDDRSRPTRRDNTVHTTATSRRELMARRKDGTLFPVELSISEVRDGKRWYTGVIHDLTRRKVLEAQVLEASTQEQQRIGQELHDGVGQELTGLSLLADALAKRLPDSLPAEKGYAAKLVEGLESVHQQVRVLCRGLVLTDLDPDALKIALDDLARRTTDQTGVSCLLDCADDIPLPDSMTARHLYRIVQEAVSNALRHGRPKNIAIHVWPTRQGLLVSVFDDGIGLSPETKSEGMGIPTMRYRANMIGGELEIRPAKFGGTVVTCILKNRGLNRFA